MKKKLSRKKELAPIKDKEVVNKYDAFKVFQGQQYTGMKIGGHHKWNYQDGVWKEVKRTPDLWTFQYKVNKKRAGKAPIGSGVPVGTEYNWGIIAFQNVKKLDANSYSTDMNGLKFKVAHKRAEKEKWSSSVNTQRKRFIKFIEIFLENLKKEELEEKTKKRKLLK